jgi:hypothetical protein
MCQSFRDEGEIQLHNFDTRARQVNDEITKGGSSNKTQLPMMDLVSSKRQLSTKTQPYGPFNPMNATYDAYEKDISIVQGPML